MNDDDDEEFIPSIDPYDVLAQHEQTINKLIRALRSQEKTMIELLKQHQHLAEILVSTNSRIDKLERRIKTRGTDSEVIATPKTDSE